MTKESLPTWAQQATEGLAAATPAAVAPQEPNGGRVCRRCRWWSLPSKFDRLPDDYRGYCHVNPPTAAGWPRTKGAEWCREFLWLAEPAISAEVPKTPAA